MYKIFDELDIKKVLSPVIDTRCSEIAHLSKKQLQHECRIRQIPSSEKKVRIITIFKEVTIMLHSTLQLSEILQY